MVQQLYELWRPFRAVGRVYVAAEGVNAQMAVPTNVLNNFIEACRSLPMFENQYINTDHQMDRAEFEIARPFKALHIRARQQIVADGFTKPLDWSKSGREMSPTEWHKELDNPEAIVLDCRNSYESDVGLFDNAIPLNTTFFKESWTALDEVLRDVDPSRPVMTYCTGMRVLHMYGTNVVFTPCRALTCSARG